MNLNAKEYNLIDYDKNPLVIENLNPMWIPLTVSISIPIVVFIAFINSTADKLLTYSIVVGGAYVFYKKYMKNKNSIILKENEIIYIENGKNINSIAIDEISSICITFNDIVTKSQLVGQEQWFVRIFYLILNPLLLLSMIIVKVAFNYFKFKKFILFDSFLVYDKSGNFINIRANDNKQRISLMAYLMDKVGIERFQKKVVIFYHMLFWDYEYGTFGKSKE